MHRCINLSSDPWTLGDFESAGALRSFYEQYGCDGVELILCGEDFEEKIKPDMVRGLHLIFYPEWIALWQDDFAYLDSEFGNRDAWQGFYWAKTGEDLLDIYRHELEVADRLGVEYVVFHVGDNALREYFTLEARRSNEEIIDISAQFLNRLFAGTKYTFQLLLENMWLGGMDLTNPELTRRMLDAVEYPHTGIMLDTGHLMVTNPALRTGEEACAYIHHILDIHGPLAQRIRGVHLHRSLSGEYFEEARKAPLLPQGDYLERYGQTSRHLRRVDPHRPFVAEGLPALIDRIAPDFLVYELSHGSLPEWKAMLAVQQSAFLPPQQLPEMACQRWNAAAKKRDGAAAKEAENRWGSIAKPLGSLGLLEDAVVKIAGLTGDVNYTIDKRAVLVMCADNGVVRQGVTQTGSEVTAVVARNMTVGDASVCRMAAIARADVLPVDMGMNHPLDLDKLLDRRVASGTADIAEGPAMSIQQAVQAVEQGIGLVGELKQQGYKIIATGEMGIGNTTSSAAIAAVLLGQSPGLVTGRGAGLSTEGLHRKTQVVQQAIEHNKPDAADPLGVLAKLGGFDIAGLVGVFIGGAIYRVPILVDGLISAVAALTATRLCPAATNAMLASHVSAEPAGKLLLEQLGLQPLITAGMYLGEGSGAVAALPLLDMGYAVYGEMRTFEEIQIESYQPLQ